MLTLKIMISTKRARPEYRLDMARIADWWSISKVALPTSESGKCCDQQTLLDDDRICASSSLYDVHNTMPLKVVLSSTYTGAAGASPATLRLQNIVFHEEAVISHRYVYYGQKFSCKLIILSA